VLESLQSVTKWQLSRDRRPVKVGLHEPDSYLCLQVLVQAYVYIFSTSEMVTIRATDAEFYYVTL
jgi:hypothetical protein